MLERPCQPVLLLIALAGCSSASGSESNAEHGSPPGSPDGGSPPAVDGGTTDGAPHPDAGGGSGADAGGDAPSAGPPVTTLRVHYPAGTHTITLRASAAPWSWNAGAKMTAGPNGTWTISTTAITAPFQFKPLLDDTTWSLGPNYNASPGATVDVYPRFTQVAGTWSLAFQFTSKILGNTRGIYVYEPPTYIENSLASMPVLYMHDGQNLFDPSASFAGNTWQVQQTMDAAATDGSIAEAIVIGIDNTADRMSEYTPVPDTTQSPPGGNGEQYLQMIIQELKPQIDSTMRTLPDRAHTSMVGSSLGGLITAYAGVKHADVFGLVGALSPSTWWDSDWIVTDVGMTPASPRPIRVYVDSGDSGTGNDDVTDTASLDAAYKALGYVQGPTLDYLVQAGGQHSEIYWAQRLPGTLAFLLGPGR
ncbi:MAG TPA: alpha/beta hydrolase-fold protein [Polyangiaceae bacterium]|nr:alpha/beta hydrolase-fold protein [Polyangiaceae bacterium]